MLRPLLCSVFLLLGGQFCLAQNDRGFEQKVEAYGTIEEVVRQPDLWIMEVQLKPMRMVYLDVRNPQTGAIEKQQVWYLTYRCLNRPLSNRPNDDREPVNDLDPLPGPRMFTPKFTLITYDNPKTEIMAETHMDQVIPDALPQIRAIERANLLSSVGIYQEVPPLVAPDEEQQPWIYGVATWQGVDPDTDFFKVIASGFSNGYELKPGTDGTPVAWRRVIVQKFARPGDRFDPNQKEFAFDGKAMWMTQPDGN